LGRNSLAAEKKDKCTGRMRTKNLEIINFSDHLCKPDVAASEVKKQFEKCKKKSAKRVIIYIRDGQLAARVPFLSGPRYIFKLLHIILALICILFYYIF